jgi:hypothetical protein
VSPHLTSVVDLDYPNNNTKHKKSKREEEEEEEEKKKSEKCPSVRLFFLPFLVDHSIIHHHSFALRAIVVEEVILISPILL